MNRIAFIVVCSIAVLGCAKARMAAGTDGATHFLLECERDAECGELSCLCGVCSKPCDGDGQCSALSRAAECSTLSALSCEVAELCTIECAGDDACAALGEGARCGDGRCVRPPDHDAGQSGSGGTSGNAGSGGTGGGADAGGACRPMDARSNGDGCFVVLGYAWDGAACDQVICGCEGSECGAIHATRAACEIAHAECAPPCSRMDATSSGNECLAITGYAWMGTACAAVMCGCVGEDCEHIYASEAECQTAHAECAPLTMCTNPTDCALVDKSCCRCGDVTEADLVSIALEQQQPYNARICDPEQSCPDCVPDPFEKVGNKLVATCEPSARWEGGECGLLDLDGLGCTEAAGCRVRVSACCECGVTPDIDPNELFAMPIGFDDQRLFCEPGASCCEAEAKYPENVEARCEENRCELYVDGVRRVR